MTLKLKPLLDRVIVKRIAHETTTSGGIVIPDSATDKPDQGEVLAVGSGQRLKDGTLRALGVTAGQKVLFGKYAGQTVKLNSEELLVMREEDIMAIIEQ